MPPFSRLRRSRAGFTILEVMFATTILVVGFIGVIQTVTICSEMQATARRQTLAAQILAHEFEELRTASWTTVTGLSNGNIAIDSKFSTAIAAAGLLNAGTTLSSTTTITLTRSVSTPGGETNMRQVTYTVTWRTTPSGSSQRDYTRVQTAFYSRYGLSLSYQRI